MKLAGEPGATTSANSASSTQQPSGRDHLARPFAAPRLTDLESAVLVGLAHGLQSKEIAQRVERSTATVEFHVRSLYTKLDARSRAHVVARAFVLGLLIVVR